MQNIKNKIQEFLKKSIQKIGLFFAARRRRNIYKQIVYAIVLLLFLNSYFLYAPNNSQGATYIFSQADWNTESSDVALHPANSANWDKYSSKDAGLSVGTELSVSSQNYSATDDQNLGTTGSATGGGFENGTDSNTEGTTDIILSKQIHTNEYTIGKLSNISVTAATIEKTGPWKISFYGTPDLSRIFKNDKFVDSAGKAWKILSVSPSNYKIIVIDSEENFLAGTTIPVSGAGTIGRWYDSISAWENGRQGDITAAGRNSIERGLCYYDGSADTTAVTVDGWTTDATHYIEITTPLSERHRGKWDDGRYRLEVDAQVPISIVESNLKIIGLQINYIWNSSFSGNAIYLNSNPSDNIELAYNIVKRSDANSTIRSAINLSNASAVSYKIHNNIIYGFTNGNGINLQTSADAGMPVYANTIYNCQYGIRSIRDNGIKAKDNIVQNISTDGYISVFHADSDYNISNLAGDAPGSHSINSATVKFVDATNFDFHLAFNDDSAKNAGIDLSGDSFPITSDIDGDTRAGSWDIGADDVGAVFIMNHSIGTNSRDFSTLQAWEDARDGVLTTRNVFKIASQSGAFTAGETITGGASGATGTYIPERAAPSASETYMTLDILSGTFQAGETLSGGTSGQSAVLSEIITTAGTIEKGEAYNDANPAFTNGVSISGSTVDANHYMQLAVESRSRHRGVAGTGAKIYITGAGEKAVDMDNKYTVVDGFEINFATDSVFGNLRTGILADTTTNAIDGSIIKNNLIYGASAYYSSGYGNGIYIGKYSANIQAYNNVVYGVFRGIGTWGTDGFDNNTAFYNYVNFSRLAGYGILKNNIAINSIGENFSTGWSASSSNNISSDSSAPGSNSKTNQTVPDAQFVSTDSDFVDLHIMSGSSAQDAGANLSSSFTTDADFQTRSGTWDIGADEFQLNAPIYNSNGKFTSAAIDLGGRADLNSISFNPSINPPAGASMNIEVAANNDNSTWNFVPLNQETYPSGPTVDEKLVREDCAGYSDCYTSLSAWQASYSNKDLVSQNKIAVAKIDGSWNNPDTIPINITGWTTGADNFVKIYTTPEARHGGVWNNKKYRMAAANRYYGLIRIYSEYVQVDGLQIEQRGAYSDGGTGITIATNNISSGIKIYNNIIRYTGGAGSGNTNAGISKTDGYIVKINIFNNLIYDFNSGIYTSMISGDSEFIIYNNTIVNSSYVGIMLSSYPSSPVIFRLKNNLVQGSSMNYNFGFGANVVVEYANNLSQDATSPNTSLRNLSVSFADSANKNFRLISSDTSAKDAGYNASSDPYLPFSTDIAGHIRNSGAWDIGAYEYGVASGNISSTLDYNRYFKYRVHFSTPNQYFTPKLSDITVNYSQKSSSSELVSSVYNTNDAANVAASLTAKGTLGASSTAVKVQVRSSPNGTDSWTSWCGSSLCDGSDVFNFTSINSNPGQSIAFVDGHPLKDQSGDQYLQYKIILESDGYNFPFLESLDVVYVVNAPPEIQNIVAAQSSSGTVTVSYDIRDPDTSVGATQGLANVGLQYCTADCSGTPVWEDAVTLSGDYGAGIVVEEVDWNSYLLTWTPKTDYANQYNANMKVRIKANDSEAANNLGYGVSSLFVLDTKNPTNAGLYIDHINNNLILNTPSDDSAYQMLVSNYADFHDAAAESFQSPKAYNNLTTDPATVYLRIIDAKGNYVDTSSTTPAKPENLVYYDVSNASNEEYREFIAWGAISPSQVGSGFSSYKIYRSTNGTNFSFLDAISDRTVNYYMDNNLSEGVHYYYKVVSNDTAGNVSAYSIAVDDIPDGQGGTDSTPPTITNVQVSNMNTTSAKITWETDELSDSSVGYSQDTTYLPEIGNASMVSQHEIILTGLSPGTSYNIRIKSRDVSENLASNDGDNPGNNNIEDFYFATHDGPAISSVSIPNVSNNQATIFWKTNINSSTYVIYSSAVSNGSLVNPIEIGTPDLTGGSAPYSHNQIISELAEDTKYYFYVKSIDASHNEALDNNGGNFYELTTTSDSSAPVISNANIPIKNNTEAAINWTTDEPATSIVNYGKNSGTYTHSQSISVYDRSHYVILTGLDADEDYYYKITSADINGNSNETAEYSFTTLKDPDFQHDPLSEITNISESLITDEKAVVSFDTDEAALCLVESGNSSENYTNSISKEDGYDSKEKYNRRHSVYINNLVFLTKYYYRITCEDNLANAVSSSERNFTTLEKQYTENEWGTLRDSDAPVISSIGTSAVSGESMKITWNTDENANSLVKYGIISETYENYGGDSAVNDSIDKYASSHSVTVNNLIPSTKYFYKVISYDVFGNFGESSENSFTTDSPSSLSSINVISTNLGEAAITWKTSQKTTSTVEYGLTELYGNKKENTDQLTEHSILISKLESGKIYHFRVKGKDAENNLYSSGDYTFQPKSPPKISNITISSITEKTAIVKFTTDVPTDALISYVNINNEKEAGSQGVPQLASNHEVELKNLISGTTYSIKVKVRDDAGNESESIENKQFTVNKDDISPEIDQVKTDSALSQTDKVQTIISWITNEPSNGSLVYKESLNGEEKNIKVSDEFSNNHSAVMTIFKSGFVYYFKVKSTDQAGNETISKEYALLTPKKKENIIQMIVYNFQNIFQWASNR